MLSANDKKKYLADLYCEIHECKACPLYADPYKSKRVLIESALNSKLFIVGEALAGSTQRRSGIPYTYEGNGLSKTGKWLDELLYLLHYTIDSRVSPDRQYIYSSDIVQCFPPQESYESGKNRCPSSNEIRSCMGMEFIIREIEIIAPKLIFLMGKPCRDTFFKDIWKDANYPSKLTDHVNEIINSAEIPRKKIGSLELYVMPMQHPSGQNIKRFREMIDTMKASSRFMDTIKQLAA